jgi:hypothetical protein
MSTVRIQVRRGVSTGAGSWFSVNPTLAAGEIGLETDTGKFKFGNNEDAWNDLPYALEDSLADYIPLSLKGNPDGIAELDSSGYIPVAQLPPLAKVTVSSVVDQAARLALTAEVGDIAIQTDTGASYVLQTAGASTNANWKELVGNEKVQDVIGAMLSGNTETGITVTYQDSDGTIDFEVADQFSTHSTSDLSEGTNKYYTDQRVTDLLSTTFDGKLDKSGGTLTGPLTLSGAPTADLQAATKLYVDNVASGINFHESVHAASVINLATIYDNGASGVGATLTANSNRAFSTLDGESVTVGQRVLIKNQTDAKQNGIYTLTTNGSGSTPWVLTRATDADNNPAGEIKYGDFCFVMNGTINAGYGYINTSTANPIVIGTDEVTYTAFNSAKTVSAGYGLAESTPGTISIDNIVTQNDASQTLTNKTINMNNNTISGTISEFNAALSDANFATLDNTVTLTNKSISLTNNTITGTVAEFNAAVSDDNFVTLTGNETLTGKTLSAADNAITINVADVVDITASASEINVLDGITASTSELNILDGVSATYEEINILDGATLSTVELNYLDGVTSSIQTQIDGKQNIVANVSNTEIGYLDGVTSSIQTQIDGKQAIVANVSDVEIGYLDGVTSAIQTQINAKSPSADPTFTGTVVLPSTTSIGNVSATEIGYLDGVTSAIQTQMDTKAPLASPTFTGTVVLPSTVNGPNATTSVNLLSTSTSAHITLGAQQTSGNVTIGGGSQRTTGIVGIGTGVTTTGTKTINVGTGSTGGTTAITIGSADGATSNVTLNGTISLPSTTSIGSVSSTEIGYLDGVTSSIQTQIDAKLASATASSTYAPIASPTFTGSVTLPGAPTSDLHAATKLYVDNVVAGINFHEAVRVATTANITLSGTQTIDGVSVVAGNRVLVKDQTDQKTNGIYVVDASTWSRATDADNTPAGELKGGDFCLVLEGGQSGYGYVCSNTSTVTIGSTNITYTAFNAAKAIVAGTGLSETTPGTLAIDTAVTADLSTAQTLTNKSLTSPTLTGTPVSTTAAADTNTTQIATTAFVVGQASSTNPAANGTAATGTSLKYARADHVHATDTTLAPKAAPTFTGLVTLSSSGIAFTDGTQTGEGVISRTPIIAKTASYTLSALTERDSLIEVSSASGTTITIPTNTAVAYPVGTSIDILQTSTGQVTIAGDTGVTVNATPGLKLRTQWSSCTLFKRATNTWVVYGDLTA